MAWRVDLTIVVREGVALFVYRNCEGMVSATSVPDQVHLRVQLARSCEPGPNLICPGDLSMTRDGMYLYTAACNGLHRSRSRVPPLTEVWSPNDR